MLQDFFRLWFYLFAGTGMCGTCLAADFHLENRVYSGENKQPVSHSVTVFYQSAVYDFLESPAETVIFDKAAGRFEVLDNARQIRTGLSTAELDDFTAKLRERAKKQQDPLVRFFAEPVFEVRFEPKRRELMLLSDLVNYKVIVASAENAAVAAQYNEFSDWYARLNSRLVIGARPPFARLELNKALADRETIAREVMLTITTMREGTRQPSTIHSEHILSPALMPGDMERIEHARQSMTKYKLVSIDKYLQAK
jgi:hypothetical protein